MNVANFKEALPILFKCKITPLITGVHGIGKSQCIKQAVEPIGKSFDFRLGQMSDVGDLVGLLDIMKSDNFSRFKMPERIYNIIKYCEENPDKYGVMFFDEINRTTKDLLQAVFQIVLDHELNGTIFPPNLRCVAAQNPSTDDYSVLDFDDDAFLDRFCQLRFEPTVKDWLDYASSQGVDATITGFIGEQSELLETKQQEFELQVKPSRRSWFLVNDIKKHCHNPAIFQELVLGMVGLSAASSYFEYIKKHDKIVKGIDILNDFPKVKKIVKSYSKKNESRDDIVDHICQQIKREMKQVEQLSTTWETNLVDFILTIPKDKGYDFTHQLFEIESFRKTESAPEGGLTSRGSDSAIKLDNHFKGWKKEIKEDDNE